MKTRSRSRVGARRQAVAGTILASLVLGIALSLPALAAAGGVGKWTDLSGDTGTNLTQVGLAATPDGLLHVGWVRDSATFGKTDLMHRTITAAGAFGTKQTVQAGWSAISDPALLYDSAGAQIRIVFGGIRGAAPGDPYLGVTFVTSSDGGASWALHPGLIDPPGSTGYASPVSAMSAGGELYTSWYGSSGVWVHRGLLPATPASDYQEGLGSFGYYSNLALEKGGALWLAWASNATGNSGLYAQMVDQTSGAPSGARYKLPSSTTKWGGSQQFSMMLGRVPATGLPKGDGVFLAYPSGYPSTTTVRLWKITAAKRSTMVLASGGMSKGESAIAAGPDGRVWVVWSQRTSGREKVVVRCSNTSGTKFGPTKSYTIPSGFTVVWNLGAAVRNGKLDVLAHIGGGSKPESTWHIQFKPPT